MIMVAVEVAEEVALVVIVVVAAEAEGSLVAEVVAGAEGHLEGLETGPAPAAATTALPASKQCLLWCACTTAAHCVMTAASLYVSVCLTSNTVPCSATTSLENISAPGLAHVNDRQKHADQLDLECIRPLGDVHLQQGTQVWCSHFMLGLCFT